jgi:Flp pilus assembly protein TadD
LTTTDFDEARVQYNRALALTSQTGDKYEGARAHSGLAETYAAEGDVDQARHHWHAALTAYLSIGVPEANHVRVRLVNFSTERDPNSG